MIQWTAPLTAGVIMGTEDIRYIMRRRFGDCLTLTLRSTARRSWCMMDSIGSGQDKHPTNGNSGRKWQGSSRQTGFILEEPGETGVMDDTTWLLHWILLVLRDKGGQRARTPRQPDV